MRVESAVTSTTFSYARTNANVTATSAGGSASQAATLHAVYDYDAFGQEILSAGPAADAVPWRFSTKYADIGLLYYGYRWYDPAKGRWPSAYLQ